MADVDRPTTAQDKLIDYAQAYIAEFNTLRGQLEGAEFPAFLYGKDLATATVVHACDGVAILYVDEETRAKARIDKGVFVQDRKSETLSHFTQSVTADHLKITISSVGDNISIPPHIPTDIPPEERKGGISPEVLKPYLGEPAGPSLIGRVRSQIVVMLLCG